MQSTYLFNCPVTCDLDAMPKTPNPAMINVTISDTGVYPASDASDLHIFTDGSKLTDQRQWGTGAGYVIMKGADTVYQSWITICHTKTVFQAEVIAITSSLLSLSPSGHIGQDPPHPTLPSSSSPIARVRSAHWSPRLFPQKPSGNASKPSDPPRNTTSST